MPSQVPAACGVCRRHEPPSQNSSWWLQISESPRFKISVDHPGQAGQQKMTGSSSSEHDTKLTLRAESSACVSGDADRSCKSWTVDVQVQIQNSNSQRGRIRHSRPWCHLPLTVRDPAMSPRRQSRHLGADKGCQRYRCHSIGSPLSALDSCPRSQVPPTFGAPLLVNSSAPRLARPPGEALPTSLGGYFGDLNGERLLPALHVEDGQSLPPYLIAPRLTRRGRSGLSTCLP